MAGAVACLLESIRKTKTNGALALLLLVVPLRLIPRTRTLAWADIVGAVAAYAAWLCRPRLWVRRAAPVVLTGALILGELAPFHFAAEHTARAFNWVPFRGLFRSDWQGGFVVLFRKSFWYGSVLWLWRAAGRSLAWTTALAVAALFLLERVQVYFARPDAGDHRRGAGCTNGRVAVAAARLLTAGHTLEGGQSCPQPAFSRLKKKRCALR